MEEREKQKRKERAQNGARTSKMMSFRVDGDLLAWLNTIANKGRLINDLLHLEKRRQEKLFGYKGWDDADEQPDRRYDYQP